MLNHHHILNAAVVMILQWCGCASALACCQANGGSNGFSITNSSGTSIATSFGSDSATNSNSNGCIVRFVLVLVLLAVAVISIGSGCIAPSATRCVAIVDMQYHQHGGQGEGAQLPVDGLRQAVQKLPNLGEAPQG